MARVDDRLRRHQRLIDGHRHGQRLEHRAELERAAGNLVEAFLVHVRPGRVDGGQRGGSHDLARRHVEHDAGRALRLVAAYSIGELGFDGVLHADVDRQAHGRALGERGALHGLDADHLVDIALDAGNAFVVDVDVAEHVSGQLAARIGTPQLATKIEARNTEIVHRLCRTRSQAAPHPDEAAVTVGQLLAQGVGVEIGEHDGQLFDGLVAVDDAPRVGEQRVGFDVGSQAGGRCDRRCRDARSSGQPSR